MNDLTELYQQIILDHNRRPRNFGTLAFATHEAEQHNPVCGDRIAVHLRVEDSRIAEVTFEGTGCAISRASASLMTMAVAGKPVAEAQELVDQFRSMVTGDPGAPPQGPEAERRLGRLAALGGVRAFPSRVKCATLPWHALRAALTPGTTLAD